MTELNRICANCGLSFGSHRGDSIDANACPGHEGQMDWPQGPGTHFADSGESGYVPARTPARDPRPEIRHVREWLDAERSYAEGKWPPGHVDDTISPERYKEWVDQYMHRAIVLGVDQPLGRQALAKALRTLTAFTESIVRRHGALPPAGVPSGELGLPANLT